LGGALSGRREYRAAAQKSHHRSLAEPILVRWPQVDNPGGVAANSNIVVSELRLDAHKPE
jgi:hypothetical protein